MTTVSNTSDLHAFLENPGFRATLRDCWDESGCYRDSGTGLPAITGIQHHLLLYHLYQALLQGDPSHRDRAATLASHLSKTVGEDGVLVEPDGSFNTHPAAACHVADALGTFCHYAEKIGAGGSEVNSAAREALLRIAERHPVVRLPEGIIGRTQQMRFEMRLYYWAWRVTGRDDFHRACLSLWENGIRAYRNPIAHNGALSQASFHPDYTWNYACGAGTTTEYATNTHTPVYYCTEAQGFPFVYHHGRREGVFRADPVWDEFCRCYFLGLLRNFSRAGHTMVDIDGYGIHRAWFSGCLVESMPVEAAGIAREVGLSAEVQGWFRWYVDQYVDFVRRQPDFVESGLPRQFPYEHNITIEKQFTALIGSRFYGYLARALYEYDLEEIAPVTPPAFTSYAWWQNWVRVSTPRYETSFVGTTSLCHLPVVKYFGDPNLGCIHGGSPLATLFSRDTLLYATSNDPQGLWHVELQGVNGETLRSCVTSFADETSMVFRGADGKILSRDSFTPYEAPHYETMQDNSSGVLWSKNLRREAVRFYIDMEYRQDDFSFTWGSSFPAGNYFRRVFFILPVPATLDPEYQDLNGTWRPLNQLSNGAACPSALRWKKGNAAVSVSIESELSARLRASVLPVSTAERSPGGENSFAPFPMLQLRLEVPIAASLADIKLRCHFGFSS